MDIDMKIIGNDFPIARKLAYMNNASNAPMPLSSIRAMTDFLVRCAERGPDSSAVLDDIEQRAQEARNGIAGMVNCSPEEIVFTQSTTEGLNYVARGLGLQKDDNIIIRDGDHEHPANHIPWMALERKGVKVKQLSIDQNGAFDLGELEKAIDPQTKLIAISHALFNTGMILPVEEVGKIAARNNIAFVLDAAQTVGCLPVDLRAIGCNFMACTGSKWLCGPLGSGIFYCRSDSAEMLEPLQSGGESAHLVEGRRVEYREMPKRFQAGFRNWVGIAGLEASVRYVRRLGINTVREKNVKLSRMLREELGKLPGVELYGPAEEDARTSVLSFNVGKLEAGTVVGKLEEEGIIFAKRDIARKKVVRASPHFYNYESEIQKAVDVVRALQ